MARGDPIELARDVGVQSQRAYNRQKKEAATVRSGFCVSGEEGNAVVITLDGMGDGAYWRFDYVHWSYTAGQGVDGGLRITDGVTTYQVDILESGHGWLPFDTTRWARGRDVTITLLSGGAGNVGRLNVLGVRVEYVQGDTVGE